MPFDCGRAAHAAPRLRLLCERVLPPRGEVGVRGFSLGSLSIAIVAALIVGGALTLFALGSLRASSEALRAVALTVALREAAAYSRGPEVARLAEAICDAPATGTSDCIVPSPIHSRGGQVRLRLESIAIEDGLLRLRWRIELAERRVHTEFAIFRNRDR